jgi:hypothetical protein
MFTKHTHFRGTFARSQRGTKTLKDCGLCCVVEFHVFQPGFRCQNTFFIFSLGFMNTYLGGVFRTAGQTSTKYMIILYFRTIPARDSNFKIPWALLFRCIPCVSATLSVSKHFFHLFPRICAHLPRRCVSYRWAKID